MLLEERIRELVGRAISERDDAAARLILSELQAVITEYIRNARSRAADEIARIKQLEHRVTRRHQFDWKKVKAGDQRAGKPP